MNASPVSGNDLYHEAQRLIREGQPVFPCRSVAQGEGKARRADKSPLTRRGLHDATLDKTLVKHWLKEHRGCALAIPTGIKFDVLDVDVKRDSDGRVHLPRLRELGLLNGCKKVVRTPSGGWHLYFKAARGLTNSAHAALGLDVRASGGYVLAAPSYIKADDYEGVYEDLGATVGSTDEPLYWNLIMSNLAPVDVRTNKPIALLPSERHSSLAALREWVSDLAEGERNNGLHWAVCRCIESGIDPTELVEAAELTGLGETEIMLTVNSALRRAGVSSDDLHSEMEAMFPEDI